jgi:hypothetical protein
MAFSQSTIPAAKAALVALCETANPTVQVTWGIPRQDPAREWVMVGNGIEAIQDDAALGQQRRDERYVIQIIVSVVRAGIDTAQEVTERAFAIVALIEAALRPLSAPPLGVTNLITALVVGTPFVERFDGDQREAEVTLRIAFHARI